MAEKLTLRQLQNMQLEMRTNIDTITDLFGQNKFAMTPLCDVPEFLDACRKRYGLPDSMSNADVSKYILDRLNKEPKKQKRPVKPMQSSNAWACVASKGVYNAFNGWVKPGSSGWRPDEHSLKFDGKQLTGYGCVLNKDKDYKRYPWLNLSEYCQFWHSTKEKFGEDGKSLFFYGVYAIRMRDMSGTFREFVRSPFNSKTGSFVKSFIDKQTVETDSLRVKPLQSVDVFRMLVEYAWLGYGEPFIQALGDMMIASWSGAKGSDALLKEFLIPGSVLFASNIEKRYVDMCIKLPGSFKHHGVEDTIYIYNANLALLKSKSDYSYVYFWFNNEAFYIDLVKRVIYSISTYSCDMVDRGLDDAIQLLIQPEE